MTTDIQPRVLAVGTNAPDFRGVLATGGHKINLEDYHGKFLIMVFYPKDQTPGCTQQLCALRDDQELFKGLNTEVVGVNPDGLESHEAFAKAQNYPFPILVDEGGKIASDYGALKPGGGIQRTVYVVNPEGIIIFGEQGMPSDETLANIIRQFS